MKKYKIQAFTEENAKEMCQWQYDGDYKVYNYENWQSVHTGRVQGNSDTESKDYLHGSLH